MDLCIGEADQQATGFGGGWTADQAEDEEAEAEDLTPHWQYTLYNMSSRSAAINIHLFIYLLFISFSATLQCAQHRYVATIKAFVPGRALQGVGYGRKYCRITFGCAVLMVFTL